MTILPKGLLSAETSKKTLGRLILQYNWVVTQVILNGFSKETPAAPTRTGKILKKADGGMVANNGAEMALFHGVSACVPRQVALANWCALGPCFFLC